jgi:hypothetical protein
VAILEKDRAALAYEGLPGHLRNRDSHLCLTAGCREPVDFNGTVHPPPHYAPLYLAACSAAPSPICGRRGRCGHSRLSSTAIHMEFLLVYKAEQDNGNESAALVYPRMQAPSSSSRGICAGPAGRCCGRSPPRAPTAPTAPASRASGWPRPGRRPRSRP